jgi:hypothetical protein
MARTIEIQDYHGDFEDVAQFTRRIWTAIYRGRMWFPVWDARFLRWQLGSETSNGLRPVAYEGTKIVASFFSIPHTLRIGPRTLSIGYASVCTADPDYRRMRPMWRLIEALRERHEQQGLAFSLGIVSGDPNSIPYRFWTHYAKSFPQHLRFLFPVGFWLKVLTPRKMAVAGVEKTQRLVARALGPLLGFVPSGHDPDVRPYRTGDLQQCAQILHKATANLDWSLLWPLTQLANQLESPVSSTLVAERDGRVQAMVNYHYLTFHGREPLRTALIDLWADDGLTWPEVVSLLGHLCKDLRRRDIDLVLALRSAMMPRAAMLANMFLPLPSHAHMCVLFPKTGADLSPPRTWSLVLR